MSKLCMQCSQKEICDDTGLPIELYSRIMLYLSIQDHHGDITIDHLEAMFKQQIKEFSGDVRGVFDSLVRLKEKCLYNLD